MAATKTHPLRGRKQTPESIAARVATRQRNGSYRRPLSLTEEQRQQRAGHTSRRWAEGEFAERPKFEQHTPETIERMREVRRQMWADGRYADKKPATRRRVSQKERSLRPYLEALGYEHTEDNECFITCTDKVRMPDYVDKAGRRVFEFFGDFWHPPGDEQVWIERYAEKGWACTVLWEHDLEQWIADHAHLINTTDL